MTIPFSDFNKIKQIFTEALEKKMIRIANRGDIDIFIKDRIYKLEKDRKNSISDRTLKESWVGYFDSIYNPRALGNGIYQY